ncbi:MAG TPA: hypothetical protein DHO02_03475 [Syntrophaceae bacterium]|nr:hypothetical protein [Syntrophaceae bacterium]HCX01463.1 hypothetical protein [Syntrophaceae bacterium]
MKKEIVGKSRKNWVSLLASLTIHAGFLPVFALLLTWTPQTVQTFHIRFEQFEEAKPVVVAPMPVQTAVPRRETKRPVTQNGQPQPVEHKPVIPEDRQSAVSVYENAAAPPVATTASTAATVMPVSSANENRTNQGVVDTMFGEGDAPRFLHRELPVYPHRARSLEREGKVVLKLFIDPTGKLLDVAVVEAAAYGFTEAAVNAVKKSTFAPARRNGHSVASRVIIAIRFRLESE